MDPDVQSFAQVMAILVPSIVVLIATGVISYRIVIRGGAKQTPQLARVDDERFSRLEQAVEAVAIEVERISEGQRFVTRILSERAAPVEPQRLPVRSVTPH